MNTLPAYIILKILTYNTVEIPLYRSLFTQNRIKHGLQDLLNTKSFKIQYYTKIMLSKK